MTITTTDLMYAAFLIVLGGTIDDVESTGRYSKLHIHIPERATDLLRRKASRFDRLADRSEGINELSLVYNMSLLKDVSEQYYILKKKLARMK